MKKLRLSLEGLRVESFATAAAPGAGGTVRANNNYCGTSPDPVCATMEYTRCGDDTCQVTCYETCARTCGTCIGGYTCDYGCGGTGTGGGGGSDDPSCNGRISC